MYLARVWALEALTGHVVGELRLVGAASLNQRFGGGTLTATVSLSHLTRRNRSAPDWSAVGQVLDWCTGGKHSLAVTVGTTVIGEWLLRTRPEDVTAGAIGITGTEWDSYPALRSLHTSYNYTIPTDQLTIARTLLQDAYQGWQPTFQLSIPAATSGILRKPAWRTREGYYSDALDEISLPVDGFDYRITHTGTWSGGALTQVNRTMRFGHPIISQASTITIHHAGPGNRQGNTTSYTQKHDFNRYIHSIYAHGAGDGARRLFYEEADNDLANEGYVKITKNVSYPDVTDPTVLASLAHAELVAGQQLSTPAQATLLTAKIPQLPKLGDVVNVNIEPTWTLPQGRTGTMRIGEVTFKLDGQHMHEVEVGAL